MRAQLTIRLPDDLKAALDEASRRMGRRESEIVRLALRAFLDGAPRTSDAPSRRVRRLLGCLDSGLPDLAQRHREYVIESLKHGR